MIEIIEGLAENVVGFRAHGRLSKQDYEAVLIPEVTKALERREKIRCYYELGAEYAGMEPGAAWEDFKIGIEHLTRWERVAVVTDVEWIRIAIMAFRFLIPCDTRVFGTAQASDARNWIASKL